MDRKIIRIVSFQNAHNFGAVLQAYGLQQTLFSMGYKDVKFINYNPKYLRDRYNPFSRFNLEPRINSLRGIISLIIDYPFFILSSLKRNRIFNESIGRLLIQTDKLISDKNNLQNEKFDILICGSDQIWNTSLTGAFDKVFLGYGKYKKRGRVISYAPSTELSSLTESRAKELSNLLVNFSNISVRESQIQELLQKYSNKKIEVCVDPTILCGKNAYCNIASKRIVKDDYILIYAYDYRKESIMKLIRSIPDYQNYKKEIILLGARNRLNYFNKNIHSEISIEDFLSYFKYASYVVTNSFHGLAFSLLFEKNFNVSFEEGKHIRCLSLLQQLGLENRFVYDQTPTWKPLEYSEINKKIYLIKKSSIDYLHKAIEK